MGTSSKRFISLLSAPHTTWVLSRSTAWYSPGTSSARRSGPVRLLQTTRTAASSAPSRKLIASDRPMRGTAIATAAAIATRPKPPMPATLMRAMLMMSVETGSRPKGSHAVLRLDILFRTASRGEYQAADESGADERPSQVHVLPLPASSGANDFALYRDRASQRTGRRLQLSVGLQPGTSALVSPEPMSNTRTDESATCEGSIDSPSNGSRL